MTSDNEGQIIYSILPLAMNAPQDTLQSYDQVLEPLFWDKMQQTVVNETLIELSKYHLYQQANGVIHYFYTTVQRW